MSIVFNAIEFLHKSLQQAVLRGASDVHFESTGQGMTVAIRLDGVLVPAGNLPHISAAEQVISRIKVLADLDIADKRIPQDGRLKFQMTQRSVDVRVSIIPGIAGEDAVLRILDQRGLLAANAPTGDATHDGQTPGTSPRVAEPGMPLRLDQLGLDAHSVEQIRSLIHSAYGMTLVTGPTGSGKTTTLYAALSETHTRQFKTVTIEDPVEYRLPGVLQIPVNDKKGLTFALGLRAVLRHDPDRILVGEIRDEATAEVAIHAALTGHQVLSTVHANTALDVVNRFSHMGVDLYALSSSLNGIVAQRLIRRLCPHCARHEGPTATAVGCPQCHDTGYRGRLAIAEVMIIDDEIRAAIIERRSPLFLKALLQARDMRSLRDQALAHVAAGHTSQAEADRVTRV